MRLIAFTVEPAAIMRILDHLGEPSRTRRAAPIRGPPWADPRWDAIDVGDSDVTVAPAATFGRVMAIAPDISKFKRLAKRRPLSGACPNSEAATLG